MNPIITFFIAWLLLALIAEVVTDAVGSKVCKIVVIVLAMVLIILGARGVTL